MPRLSSEQLHSLRNDLNIDRLVIELLQIQYTRGIPRLINNLATACLINAATQNRQKVDLGIFRQTVREFPLYS